MGSRHFGDPALWVIGSALALLFLLAGACGREEAQRSPALPPGFAEAFVPSADVKAFVYASQGQPLGIPLRRFDLPLPAPFSIPPGAPERVGLRSVTAWVGPSLDEFGAMADFSDQGQAQLLERFLQGHPSLWQTRQGAQLFLVRGSGPWAQGLRSGLPASRTTLSQRYSAAWDLLQELPANPPGKPLAAGFVQLDQEVLQGLARTAGVDPSSIIVALNTARVREVAFAVYAEKPLELPQQVDLDYVKKTGLGLLLVTRAGYPRFVVSAAFGTFVRQAGLEKFDLHGTTAYHAEQEGLHLVVRPKGNLIFVAISPDRTTGEALMATVTP